MRSVNLATLLFFIANGIAVVAIPPYLRDLGVTSDVVIGAVVSTAFFVSIVTRPLSGYMGERIGYGRVMRLGVVFAVLAQLLYLRGDLAWVQAGRVLHGLAIATFLPMSIATSVAEGVKAIAARSLAVGVGNVLGPLIGAALYDLGGGRVSFTTAMALHAVNWLLVRGIQRRDARKGEKVFVVERRVVFFMALLTIYATVYMSVSTFTPVRLKDHGLPLTYWGLFSSVAAFTSLLPRAALTKTRLVNPLTAAASNATAMVGLLMATYAEDPLTFIAAGAIYGLGQGAIVVTHQILALAGARNAGLASSIYTMGWDLGSILGPTFSGNLVEAAGFSALHYVPIALLINVAALLLYTLRKG
ncbi:MAG: MFS transporter [Pyrobaculum sp.]|nr:MFS transporter [Pyrobaculum sp.]